MKNWNGKPYHSFDSMLKERFHGKVYKAALNGGMTCPNRDGTLGSRGCIFCSAGGSGDFAGDRRDTITQQIETQTALSPIFRHTPILMPRWNTFGASIQKPFPIQT